MWSAILMMILVSLESYESQLSNDTRITVRVVYHVEIRTILPGAGTKLSADRDSTLHSTHSAVQVDGTAK